MEHVFLTPKGKNKMPWTVKIKCDDEDKMIDSILDIFVDSFINKYQQSTIDSQDKQR